MQSSLKQFSGFVSDLNARVQRPIGGVETGQGMDAQELANWGVNELAETVGFDCAWYGWAQLLPQHVQIHAQCSLNLSDSYYNSWCEMSEQDLLAAAILENPSQTAVYNRSGETQTDGMISLADDYGLNKMATAMHVRAGRSASFYISGYRGGKHSRVWSSDELDFLHCAVSQLSASMTHSAAEMHMPSHDSERSMMVNDDGIVILGLAAAFDKWGSLWPEWKDDRLPELLRKLIAVPGEHVLVDRQLIVTCEPLAGVNSMHLRKLRLRKLSKFDLLTQREQQVAGLLADGNSHKEAARLLGIAPATVRNQTRSIYAKMGVRSRAELVPAVRMANY